MASDPPQILCGPLLRQTSTESVAVWILLSSEMRLRLDVYSHRDIQYKSALARSSTRTTPIVSSRSFVACLVARPPNGGRIPSDQLLTYRIMRINADLSEVELVGGDSSHLSMPGCKGPTFFVSSIRSGIRPRPIYFGSCNKLAASDSNAVHTTLREVENTYLEDGMPNVAQALFLVGDQVYSDDIADEYFGVLGEVKEWIGVCDSLDRSLEEYPDRKELVAGFFTTSGSNQLLSFREISAQYLLAWNPECWKFGKPEKKDSTSKLIESASAWRRLLANVPTYMIFDDHEVTDDWNLDSKWIKRTRENTAAARVISNALAAYWLFQGWGNDPVLFGESFATSDLSAKILHLIPGRTSSNVNKGGYEKLLLNLASWSFSTPTVPACVFMDTRSLRVADTANFYAFDDKFVDGNFAQATRRERRLSDVILMSRRRMANLADLTRQESASYGLIVVAPSPIFGAAEIEQRVAAAKRDGILGLFEIGAETLDLEGWFTNPSNLTSFFSDFVHRNSPRRLTILSGDVHYSFVSYGLVRTRGTRALPFLQVTSSSVNNEPSGLTMLSERFVPQEKATFLRRSMFWRGGDRYKIAEFWEESNELSSQGKARLGAPDLDVSRKYWEFDGKKRSRSIRSNIAKIIFESPEQLKVEILVTGRGGMVERVLSKTWTGSLASIDYPASVWK